MSLRKLVDDIEERAALNPSEEAERPEPGEEGDGRAGAPHHDEPEEGDEDEGDEDEADLSDEEIEALQKAAVRAMVASGKREPVWVTDNDAVLVADSIAALAKRSSVYQHAGALTVINYDPEDKSYRMNALTVPGVRRELSGAAVFYKKRKGKLLPRTINVPTALPAMVHSAGTFRGVRPLRGISPVPILHADGSVFAQPGYDPSTGLVYYPTRKYPAISTQVPTIEEARAAAEEILAVYDDFPLSSTADKAAVLALILTLIARHQIDGPTPGFLVKANTPGAGKGKVIEVSVAIALGTEVAIMTPTDDDAEDRKQITACLRAGDRIIAFDNVVKFGGAVWDGLLTSTKWSSRNLGKTEQLKLPVTAVVTVTSNGCRLVGDAGRRTLPIRLHTNEARPEDRKDFKLQLPRDAIAAHPRLFVRALDILRFGLTLTAPPGYWGSYESWCRIIRRTVTAVIADPCLTRTDIADSDDTRNNLTSLLSTLLELGVGREWTSSDLVKQSRPKRDDTGKQIEAGNDALAEALAGIVGDAERVIPQHVGAALRTHLDRRVELADGSNARLTMRVVDGRPRWKVETESPPAAHMPSEASTAAVEDVEPDLSRKPGTK